MTGNDAKADARHGLHPVAWLLWATAGTLAVATTRNPLYLALVLLCAGGAYRVARAAETDGVDGGMGQAAQAARWALIVRVVVSLLGVSLAFNVLTVHAGDRVFARLPGDVPLIGGLIGGSLTANALVYGLLAGLATLTLILTFAAVNAAVGYADLLRLLPAPLAGLGVTLTVALGFLPQTLAALVEVREAMAVRGLPPARGLRDLPPLVLPVLALGLERAVTLAETMAARGFGMPAAPGARPARTRRTAYRALRWTPLDSVTAVGAACSAAGIIVGAFAGDALMYYPYPALLPPPFAPAVAAALAPLLLPALLTPYAVATGETGEVAV